MIRAYGKDIGRTITKGKKRFAAIAIITVLGVAMFSGLKASCEDLRISADAFYDEGNLHDLYIVSTMGLTKDDVDALKSLNRVENAEGMYSESRVADMGDKQINVLMKTLSKEGIDKPYLTDGRLPEKKGEAAVTKEFLDETGSKIGDTITLQKFKGDEDKDKSILLSSGFTITGTVIDIENITNPDGSTAFRGGTATDLTVFITDNSVDSDIYTYIIAVAKDAKSLLCYSDAYEEKTEDVKKYIEKNIKGKREKARYDEIYSDAMDEYNEAEAEAKKELADAKKELDDAEKEYEDGQKELAEALDVLNQKQKELDDYKAMASQMNAAVASASDMMLGYSEADMLSMQATIDASDKELKKAWDDYYKGVDEAKEGRTELDEGWEEYYEAEAEANDKLADALAEIEDIERPVWYVQNRNSLSAYKNVGSDADSIEAIGTVFPVVFLMVAILISLTTITRMVDEDRGLIGTYKAMGFTNREIRRKYEVYSILASLTGSVIGSFMAFVALPVFISTFFKTMYLFPEYRLTFVPTYGLAGILIFVIGILSATMWACRNELIQTPAALMRPKAPKAGSRLLLERVTFIWRKLSFLNKVTARNLFRYKKRMFMTIVGITGCMALLLFGYAVKDSVVDLMPRQYGETFDYDLLMVGNTNDNKKLKSYIDDNKNIDKYINIVFSSVTITHDGEEMALQILVTEDGEELSDYIDFTAVDEGKKTLKDGDIFITRNAANVLGLSGGDTINIQLMDMQQADAKVSSVVNNYLSNYLYMNRATYEEMFEDYKENGMLVKFADTVENPREYADELSKKDGVLTCLCTENLIEDFSEAFKLINMVVYVVIVMSAALAFVVLFTLSTTNISERERELATIKVLGFYDREVHLYVDKETLILTGIGMILGIPLGRIFAQSLTVVLNLPAIYLEVSLHTVSYVISAGLTIFFAIIVNFITDRSLDKIDPVGALKAVE